MKNPFRKLSLCMLIGGLIFSSPSIVLAAREPNPRFAPPPPHAVSARPMPRNRPAPQRFNGAHRPAPPPPVVYRSDRHHKHNPSIWPAVGVGLGIGVVNALLTPQPSTVQQTVSTTYVVPSATVSTTPQSVVYTPPAPTTVVAQPASTVVYEQTTAPIVVQPVSTVVYEQTTTTTLPAPAPIRLPAPPPPPVVFSFQF